jgi:hypothetical protein
LSWKRSSDTPGVLVALFAVLRELMIARGLDASDKGANIGGALRSELADETELDADNPQEVQQRLIEQAKKRQEILEQLQRQSK